MPSFLLAACMCRCCARTFTAACAGWWLGVQLKLLLVMPLKLSIPASQVALSEQSWTRAKCSPPTLLAWMPRRVAFPRDARSCLCIHTGRS